MLQGESDMAYRNKLLGTFQLVGIPPAPRGVPQVEVTFDIDANGIVHVSAKDLGTGQEQAMTITGGTALSKDEIDRMMKDAEAHAEEDRKRREEAEIRNNADQLVFQTEKLLKDQADKVERRRPEQLEAALKELKDALAGPDIDAVTRAPREPHRGAAGLLAAPVRGGPAAGGGDGRRRRRPGCGVGAVRRRGRRGRDRRRARRAAVGLIAVADVRRSVNPTRRVRRTASIPRPSRTSPARQQ